MSVEQLEQIKQQIAQLSDLEQAELQRFLANVKHTTSDTPRQNKPVASPEERRRRAAWIAAHQHEVGGRYVALDGDRLLGTGKNYPEAFEIARRAGVENAFVDYIPAPDEVGYCSGWV